MSSSKRLKHFLPILVVLFLAVAASRILHLGLSDRPFHTDEVWSIWQLIGTYSDYSRDANWPPLFYILLDGWRRLVGLHPVALRMLSVLVFLISVAFVFRIMRRLRGDSAGALSALAYSAVGVSIFITTEIRGYALVFSLLPVALWLAIRYFDCPRLWRAVPLALVMAAMFYTAYGSFGAFLMLGLYTLIVYRQRVWRWWLPGILAVPVSLSGVLNIAQLAVGRVQSTQGIKTLSLIPAVIDLYRTDAGYSFVPWLILFAVASLFVLLRQRPISARTLALLVWALAPVLVYVLNAYLGLFAPVYAWFIVLGLALWIGLGLSYLPRIGQFASAAMLVGILATPVPFNDYRAASPSLPSSFEWLAQHVQWGDVVVIDPKWQDRLCNCIDAEMWDYLIKLYFPQGLQIADYPRPEYRRVWYLKWDSLEDKEFEQAVRKNRVASIFVGPPEALFRLYEGPPDPAGVLFQNGLRFLGAEVVDESPRPLVRRTGDTLRLRLWWSVDKSLAADYSVALHVYGQGQLVMQSDSAPQADDAPKQTSRWLPGRYYVEERALEVPKSMVSGAYPIYLTVYQWWDGKRIAAPGVNADTLLPILTLNIRSW